MADVARGSVLLTPKFDNLTGSIERQLTGAFSSAASIGSKAGASTGKAYSSGLSAKAGAVMGLVSTVTSKAFNSIANSLDSAISRVDTMNNFPKVMKGLGYSADDATAAVKKMGDHLTGLPTKLDAMTSSVQKIVPTVKDVGKATDIMLAFNDALLAGGASTQVQEAALEQFTQVLAKGKPEMEDWRSIVTAMPGQMDQVAKSLLGANASSTDLYNAMKTGKVSVEDLENAFVKLDNEGYAGFDSFAQQAISGTSGIATSFSNMKNAVVKDVAKVLDAVGTDFVAGRIQASTRRISELGDVAAGVVTNVKTWLTDLYAKLGANGSLETFRGVVQRVSDTIGSLTQKQVDWTKVVPTDAAAGAVKGLADSLKKISDWVYQNSDAVASGLSGVAAGFAAFKVTGAAQSAVSTLKKLSDAMIVLGGAANAGGNSNKILDKTIEAVTGNSSGAIAGVMRLYSGFKGLAANARSAGGGLKGLLSALGPGKWAVAAGAIAAVVAALAVFFTKTETGKQVWGRFTAFVSDAMGKLQQAWAQAQPQIEGFLSSAGAALSAFAQAAMPVLSSFASGIGQMLAPAVSTLPQLGAALSSLGANIVSTFSQCLPYLQQLGTALVSAFMACLPAFQQLGTAVSQLLPVLVQLGVTIASAVAPVITAVIGAVGQILSLIGQAAAAVLPQIMTLLATLVPFLVTLAATFVGMLVPAISAVMNLVSALMPVVVAVVQAVVGAVIPVISTISGVIQGVIGVLTGVITFLTGVFSGNWSQAWSGIQQVFNGVWQAISSIASGAVATVKAVISGFLNVVKSIWSSAWNGVKTVFTTVFNGLKGAASSGVNAALNVIKTIKGKVTGFFSGAGSWLVSSGKSLLEGFARGVQNAVGSVTSAVSGALSKIRGLFPFSPAKWGPFSGHGYTTYSGRALMGDFGKSISSAAPGVIGAAAQALSGVRDALTAEPVSFAASSSYGAGGVALAGASAPGSMGIHQVGDTYYVNVDGEVLEVDERIASALKSFVDEVKRSSRARRG